MTKKHFAWFACILILVVLTARGAMSQNDGLIQKLQLIARIYAMIEANYVEEVDSDKLFEGAVRGMAQALGDPHTTYLDIKQSERFASDTEGEFGGLGIEISMQDGILTVVSPIPGTPAYEAGVLAGDKIIQIEGESTEGLYLQDAVEILRGKPGTDVTITVRHINARENKEITITRAVIKPSSFESSMILPEKNVGYIHLYHFTARVVEEFDETLESLLDQGMEALVLDLRGNPGGLLPKAVHVSDRFISEGVIVSVKGRRPEEQHQYTASANNTLAADLPVVVLVDRGSASASEIVAGCLRDHGRALVIGERTFGKGSVQRMFPVPPDGATALKLTTARYYTPDDHPIEAGRGIEPDISIPMTTDQMVELRRQEREDKMRGTYVPGRSSLRRHGLPGDNDEEENDRASRRDRVSDIQLQGALKILEMQLARAPQLAAQ